MFNVPETLTVTGETAGPSMTLNA
jgi:hypothetical protein